MFAVGKDKQGSCVPDPHSVITKQPYLPPYLKCDILEIEPTRNPNTYNCCHRNCLGEPEPSMPDINSVPRSPGRVLASSHAIGSISAAPQPQSLSASRRTSTQMPPPPVPQNSSLPNSPRPSQAALMDNSGVGLGPGQWDRKHGGNAMTERNPTGPIRHPRPLTAAELHLELEKEQESIVSSEP